MANIDSGSSWLLSIPDALCRTFSLFTLHINAQGHCLERLQWCMHANESIIFSSRAFPECRLSSAKEREHCIPWSAFKNHVLITGALFTCQQWMHTHPEFICKIYIHFTDETDECVCVHMRHYLNICGTSIIHAYIECHMRIPQWAYEEKPSVHYTQIVWMSVVICEQG